MIALDDTQMDNLLAAAKLLPTGSRDAFLRSVANRLNDICQPTNSDISEAITFVLSSRGVATSQFLRDAATIKEKNKRE
jgi:hypothetical protein